MIEERTAQLQNCMYQYSRAIYRSIKDLIEPYAAPETQLESRRAVLEDNSYLDGAGLPDWWAAAISTATHRCDTPGVGAVFGRVVGDRAD